MQWFKCRGIPDWRGKILVCFLWQPNSSNGPQPLIFDTRGQHSILPQALVRPPFGRFPLSRPLLLRAPNRQSHERRWGGASPSPVSLQLRLAGVLYDSSFWAFHSHPRRSLPQSPQYPPTTRYPDNPVAIALRAPAAKRTCGYPTANRER
jgi:hypothetical protein